MARSTLSAKVKDGSISSETDEQGRVLVDTSEVARLYEPRRSRPEGHDGPEPATDPAELAAAREKIHALELELERTRSELTTAEALATERATHLADLRRLLPPPGAAQAGGPAGKGGGVFGWFRRRQE